MKQIIITETDEGVEVEQFYKDIYRDKVLERKEN